MTDKRQDQELFHLTNRVIELESDLKDLKVLTKELAILSDGSHDEMLERVKTLEKNVDYFIEKQRKLNESMRPIVEESEEVVKPKSKLSRILDILKR